MNTLKKLWLLHLSTYLLSFYLLWQIFRKTNLESSGFLGLSWIENDLNAILYTMLFFGILSQNKIKISHRYIFWSLLIVISPCIFYRLMIYYNVKIPTIMIYLFPISIISIEYLINLTNFIQHKIPTEHIIQKIVLLASKASMRILFSVIILITLLQEGLPEWLINPLIVFLLTCKCIYIVRIGILSRKM